MLQLMLADLVPGVVEDHEPGAGGPLVDRGDEIRHGCPPSAQAGSAQALLRRCSGRAMIPGCLRSRPGVLRPPRLGDWPLDFLLLLQPGVQDITDEQVIEDDADHAADQRPDDRYPEVVAEG